MLCLCSFILLQICFPFFNLLVTLMAILWQYTVSRMVMSRCSQWYCTVARIDHGQCSWNPKREASRATLTVTCFFVQYHYHHEHQDMTAPTWFNAILAWYFFSCVRTWKVMSACSAPRCGNRHRCRWPGKRKDFRTCGRYIIGINSRTVFIGKRNLRIRHVIICDPTSRNESRG